MSGRISYGCSLMPLAMGSEREKSPAKRFTGKDEKLWKSSKTSTLCYTVSRSLL
jgi:hypothetical protein